MAEVAARTIEDPLAEAQRVADAAAAAGLPLRATGGVAIAMISPSARTAPLQRAYGDIDFVARSGDASDVIAFFTHLGYAPEEQFNVLHGQRRLFFTDVENGGRQADVFLDRIEGCHTLELRDRLDLVPATLTPADLLLSKLQVFQTNQKDFTDALAILSDHALSDDESGISRRRLGDVLGSDWGWWKTVSIVTERAGEFADNQGGLEVARGRIDELSRELEEMPKSRKWKMRSRIGERARWYEEPDEIEHEV
ncbi:MAG: hypothetical protein BGO11_15270 [Solirubrobacterales bacterium 70-9]|nr:MAG: hypothetical protein BGO11_15270 [Solirubrobacterales bacterium 70-9]